MITPTDTYLQSKNPGRVLQVLVWGDLIFGVMFAIFSLLEARWPSFYQSVELLSALQAIASLVVLLLTVIVFLVWMYLLHRDLNQIFNDYPISPKGALARLMIPLYNLWGIWNVFSTMARYLSDQLRTWLSAMYGVSVVTRVLDRLTTRNTLGDEATIVVTVLAAIANVALYVVWLRMTMIIARYMDYHAERAQSKTLGMRDVATT